MDNKIHREIGESVPQGTPRGQKWVSESLVLVGEYVGIWNYIDFFKGAENFRKVK